MMDLRAFLAGLGALAALLATVLSEAGSDPWAELTVEDAAARAKLPPYRWIEAAAPEELTSGEKEPEAEAFTTWSRSYGDNGARRYSALTQINRDNVHLLERAWTYHSGDGEGNIQCNPIIVNGVMYAPTVGRCIVAVDAANGEELWRYQVERPERIGLADAPARRGLLYWPGDERAGPRLVFASGNFVYALDPDSGKPIETFGNRGRAFIETGGTAGGAVFRHVLMMPGLEGDIFAYDIHDGKPLWRFHTIPEKGEFGYDTWRGSEKDGAHCWGGMSLDDKRGIAYFAIGAPRMDFVGVERLGDNLFSNCVLALDALTGERIWHFQNVRHDIWDLDNPAPPSLVTLNRDGRKIAAVACVTKGGDTLLLDRTSGKPIFPFRLRKAPTSKLPGERTAPYQPDPVLPEPISDFEFEPSEVTNRTPEAREYVMSVVKRSNYGWFAAHEEGKPTLFQSTRGGAEWTGVSIDMENGWMYVNSNHLLSAITVVRNDEAWRPSHVPPSEGERIYRMNCMACHGEHRQGVGTAPPLIGLRHRMADTEVKALFASGRGTMPPMPQLEAGQVEALLDYLMRREPWQRELEGQVNEHKPYVFLGYNFLRDHEGYPGVKPPWGRLNCIDLNTGRLVWRVPLGEYPKLAEQGYPVTGTENLGGATVTAGGVVFCAGTRDEKIRAFDKLTGEELWSAKLPWGGYAPPSVYEVDGRQFVVIAATGGGKVGGPMGDAYVAFALPRSVVSSSFR